MLWVRSSPVRAASKLAGGRHDKLYPPPPPPVYYPRRGWAQAHVDWCFANYRSYNPATDTFMGYDGYAHRCISPY